MSDKATSTLGSCDNCDGQIVVKTGPGRVREYLRGVFLVVPDDFGTPACAQCGKSYMAPEFSEPLDESLRQQLTAHVNQCVGIIQKRDNVTQQQIEDAFGVTRSYLSHLLAGRKEPSATLVKLLEVCALFPECYQHVRERRPFEIRRAAASHRSALKARSAVGLRAPHGYAPRYDAPVSVSETSDVVPA
jgi:predicted XRE-type DNA-binding protein